MDGNGSKLQIYDEIAIRTKAAYAAFSEVHEAKNPRPVPPAAQRDYVSIFIIGGMILSTVAGVIVSGSRTIPEFGGGFIGSMAFMMIEGGIVSYAFFRARRNKSESRVEDTRKRAAYGLVLGFIVAIGANVDNEFRSHGINVPDGVSTIINLLVALSAPTLAFISSDVIAIELMAGDSRKRQTDKEYQMACAAWQEGLNKAWASQQNRWGLRIDIDSDFVVEKPALPYETVNINQKSQRNKPSVRLQKALDYLNEHPEDLEKPSRELEVKIEGVSYGTIFKAQQMIRTGETSSNGHAKGGE